MTSHAWGADNELSLAAYEGNLDLVTEAIENGANVNTVNSYNASLLLLASIKGHLNIVKYLLSKGASVEIYNKQGMGPLYASCMFGHTETAQLLLMNNANPNVELDGVIATPLMSAVVNFQKDIVILLLKNGANIKYQNKEGKTVLDLATDPEIIKILRSHAKSS